MANKVMKVITIQLEAGKASPAPPVGTVLGPTGVNIMSVCKDYNAKTQDKSGIIPAVITVYEDRSFSLITKTPPTSELIKKAAKISKGSGEPNKNKVASLTKEQAQKIAEEKMPDLNAASIEAAIKMVEGTARSMGVEIK